MKQRQGGWLILILLLSYLVSGWAVAAEPAFYDPYLHGQHVLGCECTQDTFQELWRRLHSTYVDHISDDVLNNNVEAEVVRLLTEAHSGTEVLKGLVHDEKLPQRIAEAYGGQIPPTLLWYAMSRGLIKALNDRYSGILVPLDKDAAGHDIQTQPAGRTGMLVSDNDKGGFVVMETVPQGGAASAGIQPGDLITQIDFQPVEGLPLETVMRQLMGEPGTTVAISYRRTGDVADRQARAHRGPGGSLSNVSGRMLTSNVGYVRLRQFNRMSGIDIRDTIKRLGNEGAEKLVLDLRNNPGGLVSETQEVCANFMAPRSLVVTLVDRNGTGTCYYTPEGTSYPVWDKPLVLLVNERSASASEIVTACLKDAGVATIVGHRTFGKGCAQGFYPLGGGAVAKLTFAYNHSPKDHLIHHVGVEPNVPVEASNTLVDDNVDTQRDAAVGILQNR